jgi:Berberine and berberine like
MIEQAGTDVAALRDALEGELVAPGDESWDAARRAWTSRSTSSPSSSYPAGADDVIAVVQFAEAQGLAVAAQGTGHGASSRDSLAGAVLHGSSRDVGVAGVPAPEQAENVEADVQAVLDAFERWSSRSYLNFKDRAGDASSAFIDDVYARLRDLKAAYDPEDLFRANHPIEPAA